jgi:chorismate lyase/3-hydroxybenzoate synthase
MPSRPPQGTGLRASYATLGSEPLAEDVLAAAVFGAGVTAPSDPRCLRINLEPLVGAGLSEVWQGDGPMRIGAAGPVRYVEDGRHLAGWIDLEEAGFNGLEEAAEAAYLGLLQFHATTAYRHVWRIWSFVTGINEGVGDEERYKQFCLGRARAFAAVHATLPGIGYPAATAVGKPAGGRSLQICWLAGRDPGVEIENPRQLAAYRYPRCYGPAAPSFSRAMLVPGPLLLISGTASIVGHESMHPGDTVAQLHETLDNLDALLQSAAEVAARPAPSLGPDSLLKVYLRHASDAARVGRSLRERVGEGVPVLMLAADICRSELLIEIEAVVPVSA